MSWRGRSSPPPRVPATAWEGRICPASPGKTPQVATANSSSNQIVLEVKPAGQFAINSEAVTRDRLPTRLKEIYDPRPEKIIFVKGDPKVKYGDVIEAMDVARGAGVKVIGVPPKDISGDGAAKTGGN